MKVEFLDDWFGGTNLQWIIPLIKKADQHGFDICTSYSLLDFEVLFLGSSCCHVITNKTKLRGFSPQANYTDQATAACRQS
jgi:hypothetical protein